MENVCVMTVEKDLCTGCGACYAVCNENAITFIADKEGFLEPALNGEKCTDCGLCVGICPAVNPPQTNEVKKSYAAQISCSEILKDSTSGGVFTALAQWVFEINGIVYGCVWDKEYNAIICKAECEDEIVPMRGSKYVWSWAGDCFSEIKKLLIEDRIVLFSGLPCQVAGLRNYLKKNYENLYLLDFLCSGAPSPLALSKYIETICEINHKADLNLKFRDKNPYGVGVHITYNGQKKKNKLKGEHIENSYYYAFFSSLINRKSCYKCPYGTEQRIADITMCDYWGIDNFHKEFDIQAGVSGLMINTKKGNELIESNNNRLKLVETKTEYIAKANNLRCDGLTRNCSIPINREAFFEEIRINGWIAGEKKYLNNIIRLKRLVYVKTPKKILKIVHKILK